MKLLPPIFVLLAIGCTHVAESPEPTASAEAANTVSLECVGEWGCGADYCCDGVCQVAACSPAPEPLCSAWWETCLEDSDCCDGLRCQPVDGIDVCRT